MRQKMAKDFLGCQIWLEPGDSQDRVDDLFRKAKESGLGWVRIFLMWPWMEAQPGVWNFRVFDYAFEAAEKYGIRIKATLTANSGPWHIGTPSTLHSFTGTMDEGQREAMERYIKACVMRYKDHPALGQWILWNEPGNNSGRTPFMRRTWRIWLVSRYMGDIEALNERWRTGYARFDEIPFPEDVPHPLHQSSFWNSYGPWLDDWRFRAWHLNQELAWVRVRVRSLDDKTETCVNPAALIGNLASGGLDVGGMGGIADVIGASYHPAWQFTYADRSVFPALMAAGIKLQSACPEVRKVEVTEVQAGNTLNSSTRPCEVTPDELARFYWASIAAGADSVTGWLFNVRSMDFEAGDWGLLDDDDRHSPRTRMMKRIHDSLETALSAAGDWKPADSSVWVGYDPASQAIEWVEARVGRSVPGRLAEDSAAGNALLAAVTMGCGYPVSNICLKDIPKESDEPKLLILSHAVAWNVEQTDQILRIAELGGTVLLDAASGRKTTDASMHRPWPGGLAERIGLRARGLQTRPDGYGIHLNGMPAGIWLLTRTEMETDVCWRAWDEVRFAEDQEPCVFERQYGEGRIIYVRGMLGPTLVHHWSGMPLIRYIVNKAAERLTRQVYPVPSDRYTFVIPMKAEKGDIYAVFATEAGQRSGQPIYVKAPPGKYLELWSGNTYEAAENQELALPCSDGIALLFKARG